jgi:GTP-binding protein HflX
LANKSSKNSGDRHQATQETERAGSALERAVLVGVDLAVRGTAPRTASREPIERLHTSPDGDEFPLPADAGAHGAVSRPFSSGLTPEESLAEFKELVTSAGGEVAAALLQRRSRLDSATLIGSGKVEEIAGVAASVQADLVVFDHDLTPTQLRNLEAALPCRVLDRTQLILDIFARHARPA